jgi:hypothetical protein
MEISFFGNLCNLVQLIFRFYWETKFPFFGICVMSRDMARAALTNLAEIKFSLIYLRHMYLRHYSVNFNYDGKIIYGVEINYGITAFTIYGFLLWHYSTCRNRKNNSASTYNSGWQDKIANQLLANLTTNNIWEYGRVGFFFT